MILPYQTDINVYAVRVQIGTLYRTCQYAAKLPDGTAGYVNSGLFNDAMNICNFVNDVSMRRKIPILGDDVLAFIDLGTKRCYYGDRSGHLTEFWYDR